jgi:phage/plasmid-associated DNA primase
MPLKKNKDIATPSSENTKSANGRKGTERTATAPKMVTGKKPGDSLPPMKFTNKKWYVYDPQFGYYRQHEENYICHLVQKKIGDVSAHQILDSVARVRYAVHYLGQFYPAIRFDKTDILINVLNGITRVKIDGSHKLEKHNSKWCFNGVLPVHYDLKALCPIFNQELEDKLPDLLDQKAILFFGAYCLIPDCRFGITLFNYGDSHTGKSTIIVHGLGAVFGDLTGCLKLSEICPETYSGLSHVPVLRDKLLNVGAEIDGREVRDTTNFKRLISGETVRAREAFGHGEEIQTCCKLAFNMNELPKINGTMAEIERIRLVHFPIVTEHGKRNFEIEKMIQLEGSGIFMRILDQFKELLKLNEFPHGSTHSQEIHSQLKEKIDPFTHFMTEYESEFELGTGEDFEMLASHIDIPLIEFLKVNNYENIFVLQTFKKRLYARFNIKTDQQWWPKGIPRNQQKKISVLYGIRQRPKSN